MGCGGEIHSVHIVGVGVEFAVEGLGDAHLILQDGLPLLSHEHGVAALAGASLQHQEAKSLGERGPIGNWGGFEQQMGHSLKLLRVVDVEAEGLARQFAALHHALRVIARIIKLDEATLGGLVALSGEPQVGLLCARVAQSAVFRLRGDGEGYFPALLHHDKIYTHLVFILKF